MQIRLRLGGPPGAITTYFIEVETDEGIPIKAEDWRWDGSGWVLTISDDQGLREAVVGALTELDAFLEDDDNDPAAFAERGIPQVADRLRFALNPSKPLVMRKGLTTWKRVSGSVGEKLDQIIAICQMGTGRGGIRELENNIVSLAQDIDNQSEDRLCPSQAPNGECNALNEAVSRSEDLERKLATAFRVQSAIRQERLDHVMAQLSALHGEFRTTAARLRFTANWLGNTYAKKTSAAEYAGQYADIAKDVLDRGLYWLVERDRNRGRGVMESTAASKTAGEGSTPSARARKGMQIEQSCMRCGRVDGKVLPCLYANWSTDYIWLEVKQRLEKLAYSDDVVWSRNEQRAILNLMWHYSQRAQPHVEAAPDRGLADAVDAAFDAYVRDRPQPYVGTTERSAYDRIKRQHEWIVVSGLCKCSPGKTFIL